MVELDRVPWVALRLPTATFRKPLRGGSVHSEDAVMFCRVVQNALAMQTHQPQIVDNNGGSARLIAARPTLRFKNSQPRRDF